MRCVLRVFKLASHAALHLGSEHVTPEHLLGIGFDHDCVANRVLVTCDANLERISDELTRASRP
jgi:hypothetical protein